MCSFDAAERFYMKGTDKDTGPVQVHFPVDETAGKIKS